MTVLIAVTAASVGIAVLIGLLNAGSSFWAAGGFALLISCLTASTLSLASEAWARREEDEEHPWR